MVILKENWGNDVVSRRNYRKSSIKPHGGLFISNNQKMVSILYKELGHKMERLKHMT